MKIALDWIAEYLSPIPDAAVVADALMNAGLPVESIVDAAGAKGPTKVLDVEVTSNRTDCFSHVGLAREIGAVWAGIFRFPKSLLKNPAIRWPPVLRLLSMIRRRVLIIPRIIRNVKVGPSPEWLVKRLTSLGLRSINNVVDITNYVLMELGQPLHAFDLSSLAENRIVVRRAAKGEKLIAIDGKEYALDPSMLVIADAKAPAAIAGVMGGKASEVTEKTTAILLESARFEPLTIRTTSRSLGLKSDSSFRFERGIDPTMAELASKRAAQFIAELTGGQIAPGVISVGSAAHKAHEISMRFERFHQIVGIPINEERALAILCALGFAAWIDDEPGTAHDKLCARTPAHRLDVEREIDLIEEVIRVHGYGHVPTLDRVSHPVTAERAEEKAGRAILGALVEAGFSEAVTVTFVPEVEAAAFSTTEGGVLLRTQHDGWKADVLRRSLLPSLLAVRRTNQNAGLADARVFENAEVFSQQGAATAAPQVRRVIGAVAGELAALTGTLELLADRLNPVMRLWTQPKEFPFFVSGASGEVLMELDGKRRSIGLVGLITPEIQRRYDLRHAVGGMELDWQTLISTFQPVRRANAVPRFPGVKRDLSVVVDEGVRWAEVKDVIAAASLKFLERVDFVTTFRGKGVGDGKKSLTLALDFRDPERTLKSEEVDAQMKTALEVLGTRFAAVLRA